MISEYIETTLVKDYLQMWSFCVQKNIREPKKGKVVIVWDIQIMSEEIRRYYKKEAHSKQSMSIHTMLMQIKIYRQRGLG